MLRVILAFPSFITYTKAAAARSSIDMSSQHVSLPVLSTIIFVLSVFTLTALIVATLVLFFPGMEQRAKKLHEQRGLHALMYSALVCGNMYVALTSAAASFAPGVFCPEKVSVLLVLQLHFIVAPVSAQVFFLWRKLRKERPSEGAFEAHQRKLWNWRASRVAYFQVVVVLAIMLAYLLDGDGAQSLTSSTTTPAAPVSTGAARGCDQSDLWDIAVFAVAFSDTAAAAPLLRALWLLTLVPLLITAPLLCQVGVSRFIPLFGDDWKKLQRLSAALIVAFLWQVLSFFVEHPTVRLVAFSIEVSTRALVLILPPHPPS